MAYLGLRETKNQIDSVQKVKSSQSKKGITIRASLEYVSLTVIDQSHVQFLLRLNQLTSITTLGDKITFKASLDSLFACDFTQTKRLL